MSSRRRRLRGGRPAGVVLDEAWAALGAAYLDALDPRRQLQRVVSGWSDAGLLQTFALPGAPASQCLQGFRGLDSLEATGHQA